MNKRQKGSQFENKVVENVYLPVDHLAENVGGGKRKRFAGDVKTQFKIQGKVLVPEAKNTRSNAIISQWRQTVEQAKKVKGVPVLHKHIFGTSQDIVVLNQHDFATLLKELYILRTVDRERKRR